MLGFLFAYSVESLLQLVPDGPEFVLVLSEEFWSFGPHLLAHVFCMSEKLQRKFQIKDTLNVTAWKSAFTLRNLNQRTNASNAFKIRNKTLKINQETFLSTYQKSLHQQCGRQRRATAYFILQIPFHFEWVNKYIYSKQRQHDSAI